MKYCERPFEYFYLDHFNGDVYLCPWMEPRRTCIGNIIEQDFDEIWHGTYAEMLRDTIRDGSFSYCRKVACPHLQNDDLSENQIDGQVCATAAKDYPTEINLAFDFICNQSCPTCRNSVFIPDDSYKNKVALILDKMIPILNTAMKISASGHGDPFASPYMMKILENIAPKNRGCHILLETNGVFLDEEHWERIKHLEEYHLEIVETTNSYREPVYNQISRNGNLKKLIKNQYFLKKLREEGKIQNTTNCMVVQDKNYIEIPEFIDRSLHEFGFDYVVLKPVYNWGNLTEEEYWFKDVLNPLHPYNEEYQRIINLPIVKDNPRVYNFGGTMMHEPKPMPGSGSAENLKNRAYFDLFKQWLSNDVQDKLQKFISQGGYQQVWIYGAGDVGRALARMAKGMPSVKGFIDAFSADCEAEDLPIWRIGAEETLTADLIIITPVHACGAIKKDLAEAKYCAKMVSALELLQ